MVNGLFQAVDAYASKFFRKPKQEVPTSQETSKSFGNNGKKDTEQKNITKPKENGPQKLKVIETVKDIREYLSVLQQKYGDKVIYISLHGNYHVLDLISITVSKNPKTEKNEINLKLGSPIKENGKRNIEFIVGFNNCNEMLSRVYKYDEAKMLEGTKTQLLSVIKPSDIGVTNDELTKRFGASNRFKEGRDKNGNYIGPGKPEDARLIAGNFITDPNVRGFMVGETNIGRYRGLNNKVNNPLDLIKPQFLSSLAAFLIKYPQFQRNENDPTQAQKLFLYLTEKYENIATFILESLNEVDDDKRIAKVWKYTQESFNNKLLNKLENPQNRIFMIVISILTSQSDGISTVGRMRALNLLKYLNEKEIAKYYQNSTNAYISGISMYRKPLLPQRFRTQRERAGHSIESTWKINPNIVNMLKIDNNGKINVTGSVIFIINNYPKEAVQLAMLFLHSIETSAVGIGILKTMQKLNNNAQLVILDNILNYQIADGIKSGNSDTINDNVKKEVVKEQNNIKSLKSYILYLEKQYKHTQTIILYLKKEVHKYRNAFLLNEKDKQKLIKMRELFNRSHEIISTLEYEKQCALNSLEAKETELQRLIQSNQELKATNLKTTEENADLRQKIQEYQNKIQSLNDTIIKINNTYGKEQPKKGEYNISFDGEYAKEHYILGVKHETLIEEGNFERIKLVLSFYKKALLFQNHPDFKLAKIPDYKKKAVKKYYEERCKDISNAYDTLERYYSTYSFAKAA